MIVYVPQRSKQWILLPYGLNILLTTVHRQLLKTVGMTLFHIGARTALYSV